MSPLTPQDSNNSQNQRQESPAERALRYWRKAKTQRIINRGKADGYKKAKARAIRNRDSAQDKAEWDKYNNKAIRAQGNYVFYDGLAKDWKIEEDKWKAIVDGIFGRNERTNNAPSEEHKPAPFQQLQPVTPDA